MMKNVPPKVRLVMNHHMVKTSEYHLWLKKLKQRVHCAQLKAAVRVNTTLLEFYWELGAEIVERQKNSHWGSGFLKQLSQDLMTEFPEMKGFSYRNLRYIRDWYLYYKRNEMTLATQCGQFDSNPLQNDIKNSVAENSIWQQAVAKLVQVPWGHNIAIISKCINIDEALYYVQKTIENNWSRSSLVHQIESDLFHREGKALSNFAETLPTPQSDLAQQLLKDPYNFDFLSMTKNFNEREMENAIIDQLTKFLLELGAGFAFVGSQKHLQVGERDFFLDLLFYHTFLHCYVVIELKTGEFEPEHAGKLYFYVKAVDKQLRKKGDEGTIGILLCKSRDKVVVEYSLSDIHKPMGVSQYQLTQSLPDNLKSSLPSIEELEAELLHNEV
jgi:predicted nuclease of restriction endonuclease-like (RecB) superfamily